ncbi:MOSC domain-containing protein [Cellulomonas gilvus]|uniref:MOSC domain containing protein n=1 Tax=Cellulomonas gilvus (strain ATCC 13127 / NRRL B-14078) TaxID=593907 RepID=F8A330_CELGA|nr:MOSC N-terminal beta barrel domain-containing protein [Cellulomonas gilvus]AEI11885.1 MOSC domain containing protein [Cellulomonas gilvus ATCC 13127]
MTGAATGWVGALSVRPVKSLSGVAVDRVALDALGPRGDRRWMLVDGDGETVTAREVPTMLGITARVLPGSIELATRDGARLVVAEPVDGRRTPVGLSRLGWALACPGEVDDWISAVLGRPVRLVWLDDPARRSVSPRHGGLPGDALSLADAGPVHLTTTSSLDALNRWLAEEQGHPPLPMERFRPTLVVDGPLEPFEEDGWTRVRVGDVTLRFAERCDRCVMTTIDLDSLRTTKEPTRTLARHRRDEGKVWFGIRLVPQAPGELVVGAPVVPLG